MRLSYVIPGIFSHEARELCAARRLPLLGCSVDVRDSDLVEKPRERGRLRMLLPAGADPAPYDKIVRDLCDRRARRPGFPAWEDIEKTREVSS